MGLKRNTSINRLKFECNNDDDIIGGVGHELLKVYEENCNILSHLIIHNANLRNGGDSAIAVTLRKCTNLKEINLSCSITDGQLLHIVEAIRGHSLLESLDLYGNLIGNAGCLTLAAFLCDPNCNLQVLHLGRNRIEFEGALAIANGLSNNKNMKKLRLHDNLFGRLSLMGNESIVQVAFSGILCNTTSINSIHSSNHTLEELDLGFRMRSIEYEKLNSFLSMNGATRNKSSIAIRKILLYHYNIDMGPLFLWDMEGEWSLKALPYVVAWYERATEASSYNVAKQNLTAIYQFARAMPILCIPSSQMKMDNKKRKWNV